MEASITTMAEKGFVGLRYEYFQIGCGWQDFERLANGSLTYDAQAFPDGIAWVCNRACKRIRACSPVTLVSFRSD